MNAGAFRLVCIILSVGFLVGVFLCALVDDTPDPWLFASLITAAGVFALLDRGDYYRGP